jgi:hypothetical protein
VLYIEWVAFLLWVSWERDGGRQVGYLAIFRILDFRGYKRAAEDSLGIIKPELI